jgi:sodium-independent sulfate anion transporter 11
MVQSIFKYTRRTNARAYATKGDRPWNDPETGRNASGEEDLPLLRAIILDFSAVNNVDATSIQNLIDVRNQLNLRAAPLEVQWHFAHIRNRWTKRALVAAGFGYPFPCTAVSVIDGKDAEVSEIQDCDGRHDVEVGKEGVSCKGAEQWVESEKGSCNDISHSTGNSSRPFFHADLTSALESVDAYLATNPAL